MLPVVGRTRSVFSFLRVAHSLWYIGCKCLGLIWSNFITFCNQSLSINRESTVDLLFQLLGWKYAIDGDKSQEFGHSIRALGINILLPNFNKGFVEFGNTERTVTELVGCIQSILEADRLSLQDAQRLRGRMQFSDGQIFGRLGRLCMRAVTQHAYSLKGPKLSLECRVALKRFADFLRFPPPRKIQNATKRTWFVFTDACYEPTASSWRCGIGGIIFSPDGEPFQFFSQVRRHRLNFLEALAKRLSSSKLSCLLLWWACRCGKSAPAVFYIDNNSARDVAISGSGRSRVVNCLIDRLLTSETNSSCFPWFARVPSPSNPADGPSRGDCDKTFVGNASKASVAEWIEVICSEISTSVKGG